MYETKLAPVEVKDRIISAQEAYATCTPAQRQHWFPDGRPTGKGTLAVPQYGDPSDVGSDPAALERAMLAGRAAVAAGYGSVRADGMTPCGTCPPCQVGYPAQCRKPLSKAAARLRDAQARDVDTTRDRLVLYELEWAGVELAARLGS
jgi:hypothetical protein